MALNDEELNRRREERKREKALLDSQLRWLKLGAIITAVILVLCGAALLITNGLIKPQQTVPPQLQTPATSVTTAPTQPPETTPTEPAIPNTVIHYLAGGNVNVTDQTVSAGQGVNGYDYTGLFMDLAGVLSGSHLTSVNFEGNIFRESYGSESACAPPQLMTALRNAGVDIIQTANSYTVHNGLRGLTATLDAVRNAGMEPVGSFADQGEFHRTRGFIIREVEGIKIAVVAFTKGMNGMGLPQGGFVNLLYTDFSTTYQNVDSEGISKILRNISYEQPDITIALVHWGSENYDNISKTQDQIKDLLLSGGVDAIVGTHPHYVQKITQDSSGRVVAYSLSDLVGGNDTKYSVLLDLEITKNGQTGAVSITGYDYVPVYYADERETGGTVRLLRIREAIAAYENNFLDKVSQETYEAMKNALERIEARVNGK